MHQIRILINTLFSILIKYRAGLVLLILLEISFLLRFHQFSQVSFHDESSRDYLVANHIYKYHEFPLAGPYDEGSYILRNGPFYFYFLALFLFVKDSLFFLGTVNIFLQLANIVIIYFLAKQLFDTHIALISSIIFSLGHIFLSQSNFLWQPYIMQPFINLSYLLLVISYQKKKIVLLILSLIFIIIAAALHRSVLPQLSLFLILVFFILKRWKSNLRGYFYIFFIVFFLEALLYLPVFFSNLKTVDTARLSIPIPWDLSYFLFGFLLIFVSLLTLGRSKNISFILVLSILLQIISAILLGFYETRYFIPVLGLLVILLSATVVHLIRTKISNELVWGDLIILIIYLVSPKFSNELMNAFNPSREGIFPPVITLINKIDEIKTIENFTGYNFFQLATYRNGKLYGRLDATFWTPLEKYYNQKFVTVDDNTSINNLHYLNNFYQLNEDTFYFLICYEYTNIADTERDCLGKFLQENKDFKIENLVYQNIVNGKNFSIYLAKKNE